LTYHAPTDLSFICCRRRAYATYQEALKCDFENWRIWENFLAVSDRISRLLFFSFHQHWIVILIV